MVSFDICKGNMGCMAFVMDAYKRDMWKAERAFQRMQDNNIIGEKLYMLWNDCCDRNTTKAIKIMLEDDTNDIIEHINYERGRGIPYEK